jgi:excinuclease ABC subunit C
LKIIQQLRNEAHRFGITFHRQKRSKEALHTALETIEGIGQKTVVDLLRVFKSTKRIGEASFEDLTKVIGPSKAKRIKVHFNAGQTKQEK